jgi:hypothetical protein
MCYLSTLDFTLWGCRAWQSEHSAGLSEAGERLRPQPIIGSQKALMAYEKVINLL